MDPRRLQRVLRQHVQADVLFGVEVVPVSDEAVAVTPPPALPAGTTAAAPPLRVAAEPTVPPRAPAVQLPAEPLPRTQRIRALTEMDEREVKGCQKCGLAQHRTQTVFGEGNPQARLMFVGEGPGQTEDEMGRPFVGRAGELLEKQIEAMGLKREEVFIANLVKCRPPNNRAPTPIEVDACSGYLLRQIQVVRPEVIVTLGGPAAKFLLDTRDGITRIRGIWHELRRVDPPIPVMPTFHPAYLLRSYTVENRRKVWEDLQQVMERLGVRK